jgi:urease beta subunit
MSFTSWLRKLRSAVTPGPVNGAHRRQRSLRATTHRLGLEVLEDRWLLSTFTVLNLLDSGPDSLRAAVAAANANPGADTIDFATTGTIALTTGQLNITDGLTINGPGVNALTVSGNHVSRVFGLVGTPTVSIADLTVANGSGSPGGGIYMAGGNLTLDRVTVTGNVADGLPWAQGEGGGLYVAGGTLTLDHSTLSSNWAVGVSGSYFPSGSAAGGGLYVAGGMVYVNQSTLSGNGAVGGSGISGDVCSGYSGASGGEAEGGGLYVAGGAVSIDNSTFSANWARGGDGAAGGYCADAPNPNYYFPSGSGGWAAGGGIRVAAGTVYVKQSTLSGNSATGGLGGGGDYPGPDGMSVGGGLYIATAAPPLADLDTFTESNTINNFADIDPNIAGPYSLDGLPRLAIGDLTVLEGNDGTTAFVFTVTRLGPTGQVVSLNYATADGSATSANDYTAASGTLTIPAGQTSGTITVLVNGDRVGEPNETFFVNLSSATNAVIADGQGIGTILDDEPRISINDMTVTEGNTGTVNATFTVSLSVASDVAVTVHYQTANGSATAGSDYAAASGDVIIAAGQTTKTFTVAVIGDRSAEPSENFVVNLSSPTNAVIADGQGQGTIVDDEPRISISDMTKAEGKNRTTTLFTFTVTLSAAYDQAVTTSFTTVNGTATSGSGDYTAKTGTLTFNAGETTKTITIEVKGDNKKEASETFYLDLFGNSGNSLLTKSRGIGTILNDD